MTFQIGRRRLLGLSVGLVATLELPPPAFATAPIVVTSNSDSGPGTLRAALLQAIVLGGGVEIQFNLPAGKHTIRPVSELPSIGSGVRLDARTQPGWNGYPLIELDGSLAGPTCEGLTIANATGSLVAGLVINRFSGSGILAVGGSGHRIVCCYSGTDITGSIDRGNTQHGISLSGCADTVIGGASEVDRCIASGNTLYGISISEPEGFGNRVIGCYVGLTRDGVHALPNTRSGILVYNAPFNTIGGLLPGERNVISGGTRYGVNLDGSPLPNAPPDHYAGKGHCHDNLVVGNYIGTTKTGYVALPNLLGGVTLADSQNNTIGGSEPGAGNVISGNGTEGVYIQGPTSFDDPLIVPDNNHVVGNLIGVKPNGRPLPNERNGVILARTRNSVFENNVIRFNLSRGVYASGLGSTTNLIASSNIITNNAVSPQVVIVPPA